MDSKVLDQLGTLQQVADKIDQLQAKRSEAAEEAERINANLESARGALETKLAEQRTVDMERRKHELRHKEEKERHQRIKGRVGEVKTGREYQAVLAETSASQSSINEAEEALLRDMELLEGLNAEVKECKAVIERIEGDATEAAKAHEEVVAQTEAEIAEQTACEKDILGQMPQEVVARYQLIRSRRGGVAVVEAKDEACTACYMRIPPQTYIEIMRGSAVLQCPNCHRILIPPREQQPEQ